MAPKITHPLKATTEAVGLEFVDGVAEVEDLDDAAASVLRAHGFKIEDSAPKELTPKQKLQAEAKSHGLSEEGTKDELEARIAEHKAKNEQQPADGEGKEQG